MIIQPCFEIPQFIELALMKGTMHRTGGVIQWAPGTDEAGQVVMWLRETSLQPISPPQITTGGGLLSNVLHLFGVVPSILNLGATIGFGIATMRKLVEISSKLDELAWTVECGTIAILGRLEGIALHHEAELWGKVQAAGKLAWQAQSLEPGSNKRVHRLEHALAQATEASERLLLIAQTEVRNAINNLSEKNSSHDRLHRSYQEDVRSSFGRLRQAITVTALRALIQSETDPLQTTAVQLANECEALRGATALLGKTILRGGEQGSFCYNELLGQEFREILPVSRIEHLATVFDPDIKTLVEIVELQRRNNSFPSQHWRYNDESRNRIISVLDSLEGVWEDLDRLAGYAEEYKAAANANLTIQEYRDALRIPDSSVDQPVCFFTRQELPE